MQKIIIKIFAVLTIGFMPSLVMAHGGHDSALISAGLINGALHPLLGLDHLLSLIAVGVLSARLKSKQKYFVPLSFVGLMLTGFIFAHGGLHLISLASMEGLILASLVMAGFFVVLGNIFHQHSRFHGLAAWGITAFAGVHGMAHGLEVPSGASALGFAVGFALTAIVLISITNKVSSYLHSTGLINRNHPSQY